MSVQCQDCQDDRALSRSPGKLAFRSSLTRMFSTALTLAVTVLAIPQTARTGGSLSGCMSNSMTERLPGATVVAKAGGIQRTTVAEADGCYDLNDLPPGTYRVTARLAGFDNVTHDRIVLVASTVTRLDFRMGASSICECLRIAGSLGDHWNDADAVLHVRLSDPEEQTLPGQYRHVATVLKALKPPAGTHPGDQVFVLQNQRSGSPGPYDVGQEVVVFLESSGSDAFRITNDGRGLAAIGETEYPAMVFLVNNGRVERAPTEFARYLGMGIDQFADELRGLAHGR